MNQNVLKLLKPAAIPDQTGPAVLDTSAFLSAGGKFKQLMDKDLAQGVQAETNQPALASNR